MEKTPEYLATEEDRCYGLRPGQHYLILGRHSEKKGVATLAGLAVLTNDGKKIAYVET